MVILKGKIRPVCVSQTKIFLCLFSVQNSVLLYGVSNPFQCVHTTFKVPVMQIRHSILSSHFISGVYQKRGTVYVMQNHLYLMYLQRGVQASVSRGTGFCKHIISNIFWVRVGVLLTKSNIFDVYWKRGTGFCHAELHTISVHPGGGGVNPKGFCHAEPHFTNAYQKEKEGWQVWDSIMQNQYL